MGTFLGNVLRGVGKIAKGLPVVGGLISGIEQQSAAKKINPVDATYSMNPLAHERFALAQTLLNARAPGSAAVSQNIRTTAANTISNINQNATSGAQALALAAGVGGQTNNAFQQQGVVDEQNYNNNLDRLTAAQMGLVSESDKVFEDQVRKFNNATNQKNQLQNAGEQNIHGAWNDALNIGLAIAGVPGGLGQKKTG